MGDWEWELGDGTGAAVDGGCWLAWLRCGGGRCGGVCVVARVWRAYGGVVAAMCAVVWVAGPVAGVLSWSSGCGATPSLVLNRESIA